MGSQTCTDYGQVRKGPENGRYRQLQPNLVERIGRTMEQLTNNLLDLADGRFGESKARRIKDFAALNITDRVEAEILGSLGSPSVA